MTRNLVPAVKSTLDGFSVTGDGSNGLANGVSHSFPWNDYGEHLQGRGRQVWGFKVSDPHEIADVGAGAETGIQRVQVDVRWPNDPDITNISDYEQLVEDEIHTQIRNNETSLGDSDAFIAHISDAQSVLEEADGTIVRGLRLDVRIRRIEVYA